MDNFADLAVHGAFFVPGCFCYRLVWFLDPPLFDNPRAADLFPTIPAIIRRVMCGVHAECPGGHSNRVADKVADEIPPLPFFSRVIELTGIQRRPGENGGRALDIKQALRGLDGAQIALSRRNKRLESRLFLVSIPAGFRGRLCDTEKAR